jgi:predicted nucleic acid-binding protein
VSNLARVEVPAAVWRKHRIGELSSEDAAVLVEEFEWDWFDEAGAELRFTVLEVTDDVLEIAARSVARHALRAFDAVQLASALAARAVDASLTSFACFDSTLADAARAEGFTLVP